MKHSFLFANMRQTFFTHQKSLVMYIRVTLTVQPQVDVTLQGRQEGHLQQQL